MTLSGWHSCVGLPCNSLLVLVGLYWHWSLLMTLLYWLVFLSTLTLQRGLHQRNFGGSLVVSCHFHRLLQNYRTSSFLLDQAAATTDSCLCLPSGLDCHCSFMFDVLLMNWTADNKDWNKELLLNRSTTPINYYPFFSPTLGRGWAWRKIEGLKSHK